MKIFLRCLAVVAGALLALYPLSLYESPAAYVCAGLGMAVVLGGLYFKRAWPGALAAAMFCLEYLIVLVSGSIALDAFVLVQAILVVVLLETTDLASTRAERIAIAVMRSRFRFMAGALTFGGAIGVLLLSVAPALVEGNNPALLVGGAVAALVAGAGVLVAVRRVS